MIMVMVRGGRGGGLVGGGEGEWERIRFVDRPCQ